MCISVTSSGSRQPFNHTPLSPSNSSQGRPEGLTLLISHGLLQTKRRFPVLGTVTGGVAHAQVRECPALAEAVDREGRDVEQLGCFVNAQKTSFPG
jgi:hypothetical protein